MHGELLEDRVNMLFVRQVNMTIGGVRGSSVLFFFFSWNKSIQLFGFYKWNVPLISPFFARHTGRSFGSLYPCRREGGVTKRFIISRTHSFLCATTVYVGGKKNMWQNAVFLTDGWPQSCWSLRFHLNSIATALYAFSFRPKCLT